MKKYQIAFILALTLALSSCVTMKVYRNDKAQLVAYKLAYKQMSYQKDSLKLANQNLEMAVDSLNMMVDSLRVELENK